jgi:hypothetical protein
MFSTVVDPQIRLVLGSTNALHLDRFSVLSTDRS